MAQHDYNISNQGMPAARQDMNDALQAILTRNSGATAPSTTARGLHYIDTDDDWVYERNAANSAWLKLYKNGKQGLVPQDGSTIYAADAEATDAYVITLDPAPAALVAGMFLQFKANTANTGAATLNVNSLGAVAIKKRSSADLVTGDILAGQIVQVVYDGTAWQLCSPSSAGLTSSDIGSTVQAYDVDTAKTDVVQAYTRQQYFGTTTLTDASSIAWNLDTAQVATVTLGGNRTLSNPTNMKNGGTYIVIVKQDGTGSRTLAYGTAYKWPGGAAPVLSTAANAVDIISFVSDGTNMFGGIQKAFA